MIEKAGAFGGSTARSGGGIWAPGNAVLRDAGVTDTPGQARAYLAYVAGADVPASLREAFLEHGPGMLDLVLGKTPLRLAWVPGYADYYPEAPGGLARGRSVEPVPFDSRKLGAELAHLARPYLPSPVAITQAEYRWLSLGPRHPRAVMRRGPGRGPGRARPGARAPGAEPGAGAGRGPAGRAAGQRRAGLAGRRDDRPGGPGRPGDRGARDTRRRTSAHPGPARGADRDRGLRAQRGDAPPLPARADRHRSGRPARPGTPATGSARAWRRARRPG